MTHKVTIFSMLAMALATFAIAGASPRSPQNYRGQTATDQSSPGTPGGGMVMGMSMGMAMGQMSAHHDEILETMAKVMQSMNAIQNERNEKALRSKLAEHRALLQELQTELNEEGGSMKNMTQMMSGGAPTTPAGPLPSK